MVLLYALAAPEMLKKSAPAPKKAAMAERPVEYLVGSAREKDAIAGDEGAAPKLISVAPVRKLRIFYDRIGFDLASIRAHGEVPRVKLVSLPDDIHQVSQPRERKRLFLKTALPLILHVNEKILADRRKLQSLSDAWDQGDDIAPADKKWLVRLAQEYRVGGDTPDPESPAFDALLKRVDIVPPSLALAQSAEESGWGTSRFAREGNALFGQRAWRGTNGMVPKDRAKGETFRVRSFDTLLDGVWAYVYNLNTQAAYKGLRSLRAKMRAEGAKLRGGPLVGALQRYSERGAAYVRTIRVIMRANDLEHFDKARLGEPIDWPLPSSGA